VVPGLGACRIVAVSKGELTGEADRLTDLSGLPLDLGPLLSGGEPSNLPCYDPLAAGLFRAVRSLQFREVRFGSGRVQIDHESPQARAESLLRELLHLREAIQTLLQPPRAGLVKPDRDLLSGRQAHALYIVHQGPTTMGELARLLRVTPAAATAIADGLVALHMAERVGDAADRRLVRLAATERGAAVIRDRNLWEHTALAALQGALLSEKPGIETLAVQEVMRLVEGAAEIAAAVSGDESRTTDPGGHHGRLRADADVATATEGR
jgi:DNA-binding MarR family transcriptional regulator